MSQLSVLGLAVAIEKEKPFLPFAVDEETYNKPVARKLKTAATLFKGMYTFFKIRCVR